MQRTDSLEKTLMLGKTEGRRRRGRQRMTWLDGITAAMEMSLSRFRVLVMTGKPGMLQSMGSQRVRHDWTTEQLNWTELWYIISTYIYSHIFLVNLEIFSLFFHHWQSFFYLKKKNFFLKVWSKPILPEVSLKTTGPNNTAFNWILMTL